MASTVDTTISSPSKAGKSTDPERGRKRRRSSADLQHVSQSANLRGRARRRSVSPSTTQGSPEKRARVSSCMLHCSYIYLTPFFSRLNLAWHFPRLELNDYKTSF